MSHRGQIIFSFGYLALVLWFTYDGVSEALASGRPIWQSESLGVTILFGSMIPMRIIRLWTLFHIERPLGILDPLATVDFCERRLVRVGGIVFGVGLLAMGCLPFLGLPNANLFFGIPAIPLAIGGAMVVQSLVVPRVRLTLAPVGLGYSRVKPSPIAWADISGTKFRSYIFGSFIFLDLKDAQKYEPSGFTLRRRKFSRVGVVAMFLGVEPEALLQGIELRRSLNAV